MKTLPIPEITSEKPSLNELKEAIKTKNFKRTLELLADLRNFLIGQVPPYRFIESPEFHRELNAFLSRIMIKNGILSARYSDTLLIRDLGDGGMSRLILMAEDGEITVQLGNSTHEVKRKWNELEK